MITRAFIKALFMMLGLKNKDEKRYPLSILNDILASPMAFKYIKELPYKEGMNKVYTLYPKEQVETILNKIYEEHKNLQGLPIPSDFLTRHPYMKNMGAISVDAGLAHNQYLDATGKPSVLSCIGLNYPLNTLKPSKPTLDISQTIKPPSSSFNRPSKTPHLSTLKPSLKQIVMNRKYGLKIDTQERQNQSVDQILVPPSGRPQFLTQAKLEQLEKGRNSVEGKQAEERNLVDKYLKGLNGNSQLFIVSFR